MDILLFTSITTSIIGLFYYAGGVIFDGRRAEVVGGIGFKLGCISYILILTINLNSVKIENFKPEYELEIVDENYVKVKSLLSGKAYKVKFDRVEGVLMKDNL